MKLIILLIVFCAATASSFAADSLRPGMTAEQVVKLKGQPYYETEHYSHRTGEKVLLYTQKKETKTVDEKQIMDSQTNWPTLHRITVTRACDVGDIFVEVSQGVVKSVIPANTTLAYGPCQIGTL